MKTRSSAQQNPGAQLNLEDSFASAESESEIEEIMTFDTENGVDEAGAHSKLSAVKVAYDEKDVEFFFINLESAMAYAGLKSQQSKRFCLLGILPNEVKNQFKGVIKATATGQQGYRKIKEAVLEVFGLPRLVTSDNGNTFVANLWKGLHHSLGIEVAYTPPISSQLIGGGRAKTQRHQSRPEGKSPPDGRRVGRRLDGKVTVGVVR